MNPEKQRIAIAEACGWTKVGCWNVFNHSDFLCSWNSYEKRVGMMNCGLPPGKNEGECALIPDYLNDLNAQFEAWKTLTDAQKFLFRSHAAMIATRETLWVEEAAVKFFGEIFLRTIGK